MRDVSNKTFYAFLIITILVVFGSIYTIFSRMGFGVGLITGAVTTEWGSVNVSISATAGISMVHANLSFGTGTLSGTGANVTLNTTTPLAYNSFTPTPQLQVRVEGNTPVNLSMYGTPASTFLGGNAPYFKFNFTENETGSCNHGITLAPQRADGFPPANRSGYGIMIDVLQNSQTICNCSWHNDTRDQINLHTYISLSDDTPQGLHYANVTIFAVATSCI